MNTIKYIFYTILIGSIALVNAGGVSTQIEPYEKTTMVGFQSFAKDVFIVATPVENLFMDNKLESWEDVQDAYQEEFNINTEFVPMHIQIVQDQGVKFHITFKKKEHTFVVYANKKNPREVLYIDEKGGPKKFCTVGRLNAFSVIVRSNGTVSCVPQK